MNSCLTAPDLGVGRAEGVWAECTHEGVPDTGGILVTLALDLILLLVSVRLDADPFRSMPMADLDDFN